MPNIDQLSGQQLAGVAQKSPMAGLGSFNFAKAYPNTAIKIAREVGDSTGTDTSTAEGITTIMHSKAYQRGVERLKSGKLSASTPGEDRFLAEQGSTPPALSTWDPKASAETTIDQTYAAQEQNTVDSWRSNAIMQNKKREEQKKLSSLADFDREAFTAQRLKELNPTQDIDQRILDLRMQGIVAKTVLRNELRDLPPNLREQALGARMAIFNNAASVLGEVRTARLESAKNKIHEEINSKNEQMRTAKASMEALDSVIEGMKGQQGVEDALYKIRMERAKEAKKAEKAGSTGVTDEVQTLINAQAVAFMNSQPPDIRISPTTADLAEFKRQAIYIVGERQKRKAQDAKAWRWTDDKGAYGSPTPAPPPIEPIPFGPKAGNPY